MVRLSPRKVAWLLASGIPGLWWGGAALSVETVAVAAGLGFGTFLFGHTVGLHRGVLHRAFRMHQGTRRLLTWLFVLTGLGGPLTWISAHDQRDHWQNRLDAPDWFRMEHGLVRDGAFTLLTRYDQPQRFGDVGDLADPWLRWLERTWWAHNVLLVGVLWGVGGWEHAVVGGPLRIFLAQLLHWWVGYEAHARGELRHPIPGAVEQGRNRWLLGVLSLGEGFHNNHHAFPNSARIGHRAWELDLGWWVIRALEAMGLAWDVVRPHQARSRTSPAPQGSDVERSAVGVVRRTARHFGG